MDKVFALVIDNVISIYPLTLQQIIERDAPYEDYFDVFFNQKPTYNHPTEYLVETPIVISNYVLVNYEVKLKTIEQLLQEVFAIAGSIVDGSPVVDISKTPPELMYAVVDLVKIKTQALLDTFAKTRDYDDIKSVCSYSGSNTEKFRVEAARAIELRDNTWVQLNVYLSQVMTGAIQPPLSWDDIVVNLPTLTWE